MDGTGRLFEPLVPFVSGRFDVRVVSYPREATRYDELERHVGVPPAGVVLVGESFGGPLALRLAARHPVAGLVLVASFVRARWLVAPPPFLVTAMHPPPDLAIRLAMLEWRSSPGLVAAVRSAVGSTPARTIAGRVEEIGRVDARSDLRATRCPVHWLTAMRDRMIPARATALARSERADHAARGRRSREAQGTSPVGAGPRR